MLSVCVGDCFLYGVTRETTMFMTTDFAVVTLLLLLHYIYYYQSDDRKYVLSCVMMALTSFSLYVYVVMNITRVVFSIFSKMITPSLLHQRFTFDAFCTKMLFEWGFLLV